MLTATGYDGNGYNAGDRVELSPASDWWMRGARYGVAERIITTKDGLRVRVRLDKAPGKLLEFSANRLRRA